VGQGAARAIRPEVRGDWIAWIHPHGERSTLRAYLERMEDLRRELNRCAYLGLLAFETHLALYLPGARYDRHRDRFACDKRRAVSTVLYLNEDWSPQDGGALRIYLEDGRTLEVEPCAGTLALFSSDLEHEVLPARRARLSLAGWFTRRA
jgi:SM-20-related protein